MRIIRNAVAPKIVKLKIIFRITHDNGSTPGYYDNQFEGLWFKWALNKELRFPVQKNGQRLTVK